MNENVTSKSNNTLWKSILKALKKRLKPSHIIFIAILIAANVYAWFIYMEKISSDIDVRVKAWNVSFTLNNQNMTDYINFQVSDIYPGMPNYTESLSVTNDGEVSARLTYELVSLKVLNDEYKVGVNNITAEDIEQIMEENYPFQISITTNQELINAYGGTAIFNINVTWPYESVNTSGVSNDELDTYWGNQAYTFKQTHNSSEPCIKVKVKLSAVQVSTTSGTTSTVTSVVETSGVETSEVVTSSTE